MTRPMLGIIFFALLSLGFTQETTSTDDNNDKSNTVDPPPSVRLDPYIRKALLKALTELEESESFTDIDTTDTTSTLDSDSLNNSEDGTVGEANKENIQIHSFVVNGQAAFANTSNTSPTLIDDKISILGTTVGNVENYVTATLPTQATFNEIFQTRESGVNLQQVRSIQSTTKSKNDIAHSKYATSKSKSSLSTTTTSTTTTTTTSKPTHNDDGENIEDVDKKDVQVFQAPLVAAFTVHQDAQGIPKKVIPIYQQTTNQEILKVSPTSNVFTQKLPIESFPNVPPTEYINQQLTLQRQLEEKQRILEEQLRFLQIQQRQQEELLRNQQFFLQQKEALRQQSLFEQEQLKRQQLLIEQQKLNQVNNNLSVHKNTQPSVPNQNSAHRPQKLQVTIQPSLSFDQSSTLAAHQQLPNKEAVDFLINLRRQHPEQFPLQENHLPQGISSFLQPNPIQSFHQAPIIQLSNQIRPTEDQFIQKQGNRVFRHENGVGNFGINNPNYNRYNTFDTTYTSRFVPGNRFSHDAELKQLLAQSSLNSRAHEDLNIVSKVLSLNHGIAINNVSNRLPFDSRRQKRTSS